jgi:PII-like signaling protein
MMGELATRTKIEVICDQPLIKRLVAVADAAGMKHYTVFPALSGQGDAGPWSDDQLTSASAKVMICFVASPEAADLYLQKIGQILDSHSLRVWVSPVQVFRATRY